MITLRGRTAFEILSEDVRVLFNWDSLHARLNKKKKHKKIKAYTKLV